jgi:hypothetical protein
MMRKCEKHNINVTISKDFNIIGVNGSLKS